MDSPSILMIKYFLSRGLVDILNEFQCFYTTRSIKSGLQACNKKKDECVCLSVCQPLDLKKNAFGEIVTSDRFEECTMIKAVYF